MAHAKISLSLDERDIAFLDQQSREGRFASRSAAVQAAVKLLRESRLADAYAEAYGEWSDDDENDWDAAVGDGVA